MMVEWLALSVVMSIVLAIGVLFLGAMIVVMRLGRSEHYEHQVRHQASTLKPEVGITP